MRGIIFVAISLEKQFALQLFDTYHKKMSLVDKTPHRSIVSGGLSMLQLYGKNQKSRVLCSTADWTGNVMGLHPRSGEVEKEQMRLKLLA